MTPEQEQFWKIISEPFNKTCSNCQNRGEFFTIGSAAGGICKNVTLMCKYHDGAAYDPYYGHSDVDNWEWDIDTNE